MTEEGIEEISRIYHNREIKENFSYRASIEEIDKNDYSLMIKKYIKEEPVKKVKIEKQEILTELEKLEKETTILENNINNVLDSLGLFDIFNHNKKE